jgi:uncharacterized protein YraI
MNLSRNGKWGIVAVVAVALVAAGAALAATKIHSGGQVNASGPGPALQAHGAPPRGDLSVAATYLGIDTSTLFQTCGTERLSPRSRTRRAASRQPD